MLAAFPPPAHAGQKGIRGRGSWFPTTSWPLDPNQASRAHSDPANAGRSRRCCGMPLWGFIVLTFFLLCVIAAAIVVPLEFFVFKNLGSHHATSDLRNCDNSLQCQNGGIGVASQGVCSCICTNGFTGANCTNKISEGCVTTELTSTDKSVNISNVTLGSAIPRLIAAAQANFSIPLSGTSVLAKFNSQNFSCNEQNALVTFDGLAKRKRAGDGQLYDDKHFAESSTRDLARLAERKGPPGSASIAQATNTSSVPAPSTSTGSSFDVTGEVLDFARVVVLFVLQQQTVGNAETAQDDLQQFFSSVSSAEYGGETVTASTAADVGIGNGSTVDLVDFKVSIGNYSVATASRT